MSTSKEFANFLEELRKSRNFSREQLTDGIISLRHYYRFINGESSLRNETVSALLDRMEINPFEAYSKYAERENEQHRLLYEVYGLVKASKYSEALSIFKTINPNQISISRHQKLYDFLDIILLSENDDIDEEIRYEELCNLIDYPEILDNNIFTTYELNALILISNYLVKTTQDFTVTNFLYRVLTDTDKYYHLHGSENKIGIFASVAKDMGRQRKYNESLELCKIAYNYSIESNSIKGMPSLLLTKAVTEKHLSLKDDYLLTLQKIFALLKFLDNPALHKIFSQSIMKIFDTEEKELIDWK
jgi:hypothetical protein